MGLWRWLFPTPEDRVAHAREAVAAGHFASARAEIDGIDTADASEVRAFAEAGLVRMNLASALQYGESGDDDRLQQHLALAEEFLKSTQGAADPVAWQALADEMRDTKRKVREARQARLDDARRRRQEAQAADLDGLQPDDAEREMRMHLIVEQYPEALRPRVLALGPEFVAAVLAMEDARPDQALQALLAFPESEPIVWLERGRAQWALGDLPAAMLAVAKFGALASRHMQVRGQHTAEMLAQLKAETGDVQGALRVLRDARVVEPRVGGLMFPDLLTSVGELPAAAEALASLAAAYPKEEQIARRLASVYVKLEQRDAAIGALERAYAACCTNPAKCGFKERDGGLVRELATLHLEGGDSARGLTLATEALDGVGEPAWEDLYLDALSRRADGDATAPDATRELLQRTPDDGRRARMNRFLSLA